METRPPTVDEDPGRRRASRSRASRLALFLWIAFGGPIPLKPEGYRFEVPFDEATQLAPGVRRADLRRLGRQGEGDRARRRGRRGGDGRARSRATRRSPPTPGRPCARRRCSARPTSSSARAATRPSRCPRAATCRAAQVADSVQLDEIFRTFDARTRAAFSHGCRARPAPCAGAARTSAIALASLDSFAAEADDALRILDSQEQAVTGPGLRAAPRSSTRSPSARASSRGADPQHRGGVLDHRAAQRGPARRCSRSCRPSCASRGRR